ncbi:hypothetical protein [Rhizohabitans arisaemae]|uniref:hypothetical protein n=1 Tax=Rhizohabitans arisaemae TaxID=2720610 RepID=UPI0024B0E53D|nr:hypothetical protein [Rhizohabitans arisaemae]
MHTLGDDGQAEVRILGPADRASGHAPDRSIPTRSRTAGDVAESVNGAEGAA